MKGLLSAAAVSGRNRDRRRSCGSPAGTRRARSGGLFGGLPMGALGGIRTPNLLIRRDPQRVHGREQYRLGHPCRAAFRQVRAWFGSPDGQSRLHADRYRTVSTKGLLRQFLGPCSLDESPRLSLASMLGPPGGVNEIQLRGRPCPSRVDLRGGNERLRPARGQGWRHWRMPSPPTAFRRDRPRTPHWSGDDAHRRRGRSVR
jgi:hypothetical protein